MYGTGGDGGTASAVLYVRRGAARFAMADAAARIDLTGEAEVQVQVPAPKPRKVEEAAQRPQALNHVFVVIHDKEPHDSGSDCNYSASLPNTQDTQIVGIFTTYEKSRHTADDYVVREGIFGLNDDDEDDDEDEDDAWREELRGVDWRNEGCYRIEEGDDSPNDRVPIQKRKLDAAEEV